PCCTPSTPPSFFFYCPAPPPDLHSFPTRRSSDLHGTGKEVVARWLHASSGRVERPLVAVNLGGIPDGLFESELFGHVKGAFTDRSEEHTSELQSPCNLVCRLLLEKKKKKNQGWLA